jgi:hypothetical protein
VPEPAPAVPTIVRPGDLILIRAIKWWDSGQIQRAITGVAIAAAPALYDLFVQKQPASWRDFASALAVGLFAWMGMSRAKAPDVVTGNTKLDTLAPHQVVPADLVADLKAREAAGKS